MKNVTTPRHFSTLVIGAAMVAFAVSACGPAKPSTAILANPELIASTEIYLGDDSYQIERHDRDSEGPSSDKEGSPSKDASTSDPYFLTKSKVVSVGMTSGLSQIPQHQIEASFVPASATKILTTAVALKELGENFRFETRVAFALNASGQASQVVVVADGDPTAGIKSFQAGALNRMAEMAQAMKARGVREVIGDIKLVSADPRLDVATYASGIEIQDLQECFGSLATAFNFRGNCAPVQVHGKSGFQWVNSAAPADIETTVNTSAGSAANLRIQPVLSSQRLLRGFALTGTYSAGDVRGSELRLPIGNGASWFGGELLQELRQQQVGVNSVTIRVARTASERASALSDFARNQSSALKFVSADLAALAEATNKPSDNFFADSLFKAVGVRTSKHGDVAHGSREKLKDALYGWLRADGHGAWASELEFHEGAGLSSNNRATPRAFLSVLRQVAREKSFPALLQSLPLAGFDGTLSDRMKNTPAAGVVRAKTGTLKGSYQLVGYIPRARGGQVDHIPFVILTSTTERNRGMVRRFQDGVVVKMLEAAKNE